MDTTWALILNVSATAVICFVLHNLAVSALVSTLNQSFLQFQVASRKAILWLLVTLPWFSALATAGYFAYSMTQSSPFEAPGSLAHWHHIESFSWLSWHGLTLSAALLFLAYVILSRIKQVVQHRNELSSLQDLSSQLRSNTYEIHSQETAAFTAGFVRPKCFITSGMREHTTPEEQDIILKHEHAHALRRDPFKKWLFSVLCAFFIPPVCKRFSLHMILAMEQDADKAVICEHTSSIAVAETLVKVARLNASQHSIQDTQMVANFGADVLEQRVHFLLGQLQLKPVNPLLVSLVVVATFLLCLTSVDGIHHSIEMLFGH